MEGSTVIYLVPPFILPYIFCCSSFTQHFPAPGGGSTHLFDYIPAFHLPVTTSHSPCLPTTFSCTTLLYLPPTWEVVCSHLCLHFPFMPCLYLPTMPIPPPALLLLCLCLWSVSLPSSYLPAYLLTYMVSAWWYGSFCLQWSVFCPVRSDV